MSCASDFLPRFRQQGYRMTPQRMAILHTLRHRNGHISPVEVYKLSKRIYPGLTEPTVYRTLNFLTRHGLVAALRMADGRTVYELPNRPHHHLVCRSCSSVLEITDPADVGIYHQLESATGYHLEFTNLTLYGLCSQCQEADRN